MEVTVADVKEALRRKRPVGFKNLDTKRIPVWHVEYNSGEPGMMIFLASVDVCLSYADAQRKAKYLARYYDCIHITGPHQHEVPRTAIP